MLAGFNRHKRYFKLRLREQILLTKRHQCISLKLGSKESEVNKKEETSRSIKINAATPMFAAFNLHKRHKLRLREQILLTKRHQCISLMELGSEESRNKIQKTLESVWYNAVSRFFAVYECHTKETKKLQEILMTKRRETARLMQLGGKYFEWEKFETFGIRSSEGSYSDVGRFQLAQKVL